MDTKLLLGKTVSEDIKNKLIDKIKHLKKNDIIPGLAAVLVGDNPASKVYVNSKSKVFKSSGCFSETYRMYENSTEEEILDLIGNLNEVPEGKLCAVKLLTDNGIVNTSPGVKKSEIVSDHAVKSIWADVDNKFDTSS